MPEYTFMCRDCGGSQSEFMSPARYAESVADIGHDGMRSAVRGVVVCVGCRGHNLARDLLADVGSTYTERPMYWGDTTPESVRGRGGYSRERKKILAAAGLRQKEPGRRKRKNTHVRPDRVTIG